MEKEANYFAVGIFVSLALLALVGFVIWLMSAGELGRTARYTVYFTDPVSGLAEEAPVKFNGVDVGRVLVMRLAPERSDLVKIDIEVDEATPIRAGTTASIELQGITGSSYLELATATTDQDPPRRVAGEEYPVLEGRGSELRAFLDELPELAKRLETALGSVERLSEEGAKMAGSIREFSQNTDKRLATTLSAFDDFSKEGSKAASSLRDLSENAKGRLDTTLSAIDGFSKEGAKAASALRGLSDNVNRKLETTLSAIDDFSKESTKTASSLRGLAEKLKDDPSQILRPAPSKGGVAIPR